MPDHSDGESILSSEARTIAERDATIAALQERLQRQHEMYLRLHAIAEERRKVIDSLERALHVLEN